MHVGRALANGLRKHRIEHADDGGVVVLIEQIFDIRNVLHQAAEIDFPFDFAHHCCRAVATIDIGGAQAFLELCVAYQHGCHITCQRTPQFGDRDRWRTLGHPQQQRPVAFPGR